MLGALPLLFNALLLHGLAGNASARDPLVHAWPVSSKGSIEVRQSVLQESKISEESFLEWEAMTTAGQRIFLSDSDLAHPQDLGKISLSEGLAKFNLTQVMTLAPTELRSLPSAEAKSIQTIPGGETLQFLNLGIPQNPDENWARVRFAKSEGFVDFRDLVTALDFVHAVALTDGSVHRIRYTLSGWLFAFEGRKIGIGEVSSVDWATSGLVKRASTAGLQDGVALNLPAGSRVQLVRSTLRRRITSRIPSHGLVNWIEREDRSPTVWKGISTQALFERGLFDMSKNPLRPSTRIASAKGIFLTQDAENWTRITQFGEQDHAVTFTENGHLIVGDLRSTDGGRTFQPYVKWDEVTPLLKKETKKVPSWMRITSVDAFGSQLNLEVEVARNRRVRLSSQDQGESWMLAR